MLVRIRQILSSTTFDSFSVNIRAHPEERPAAGKRLIKHPHLQYDALGCSQHPGRQVKCRIRDIRADIGQIKHIS